METQLLDQVKNNSVLNISVFDRVASKMQGTEICLNKGKLQKELKSIRRSPKSSTDFGPLVVKLQGRLWDVNLKTPQKYNAVQYYFKKQIFSIFLLSDTFQELVKKFGNKEATLLDNFVPFGWLFKLWVLRNYPLLATTLFSESTIKKNDFLKPFEPVLLVKYLPKFVLFNFSGKVTSYNDKQWTEILANGLNIRSATVLKIPLSKKEAHYFYHAPYFINYHNAFLFGRMKARGASELLFNIFKNHFNGQYDWSPFWDQVVLFFIKYQADLDQMEINRLLGFLRHQVDEQTGFSMKGRTLVSLHNLAETWYEEMQTAEDLLYELQNPKSWVGANYEPLELKQDGVLFKLIQLKTFKELSEESRRMSHCVRTYAHQCSKGQCSIWSLRMYYKQKIKGTEEFMEKDDSLVTIEVNRSSTIIQTKAKYNATPDFNYLQMIKKWAKKEKLKVDRLN